MTLKLSKPAAFITKAMVVKKYGTIQKFAKAAGMTRANVYLIIDNPRYGHQKNSRKTVKKLLRLLGGKK
jgi:hypothetical protein